MYFISNMQNNERSINNISNDMIDNDNVGYEMRKYRLILTNTTSMNILRFNKYILPIKIY